MPTKLNKRPIQSINKGHAPGLLTPHSKESGEIRRGEVAQEKVLSISSAHDSWSVEPAQRDYSWVVMERRVTVRSALVVRAGAFCRRVARRR